ncbi:hypothetical protein DYU11_18525 [Fibrisoma montanum]|uniref:Uncharacterized protein n=2 Tax=Fibrisoma montanum TaxID=2305895 RepID=A0A418M6A8_9BACT|nr:hypothetical protein DYU11_18525 [Fibrisoma montanum]
MDAVQSTIPEAAKLTSKSKVSVFGTLRNIWALFVQTLEHQFDVMTTDLQTAYDAKQIGTVGWYADQVRNFQYGDRLTFVNGRPGYAVIDDAKRIVRQVSVTEVGNSRLLIKAAKPDGLYMKELSNDELNALRAYVRNIKYAGVKTDVVSLPADELRIRAVAKIDPQIMNPDGMALDGSGRKLVHEAIIIYARSLPFDGVFSWTGLTDVCQTYLGIKDFVVRETSWRPAGSPNWQPFERELVSPAGHMKAIEFQIEYIF